MSKNYAVITMLTRGTVEKKIQRRMPTLEQLQAAVGGFIERVPRFSRCTFQGRTYRGTCYANEEGRIKGLAPNERATDEWQSCFPGTSILVGNVVFVARTEEGAV